MCRFRFLYILVLTGMSILVPAQGPSDVDRLRTELSHYKTEDTIRFGKLIDLAYDLSNYGFKESISYATEALQLSRKLNYTRGEVTAYNCMADAYWFHSDYDKAQQHYFKAYRINDSLHDQRGLAFSMYNIGWILCIQQENYKQDSYLYRSLAIYTTLKDTSGLLKIYNALASYYTSRRTAQNNKQYFDSALNYFNQGIALAKGKSRFGEMSRIYGNLGDLFYREGDCQSANFYNEKSKELHLKTGDSSSLMICMLNIGLCDLELGKIKEAEIKFKLVYDYNVRHDMKETKLNAIYALAKASYKSGRYKEAFDRHEEYMALRIALDKEAYSTSMSDLQGNYSLEKSQADIAQLKQTNEIHELRNKKNTYFIIVLLSVGLVVIVIVVLLYRQSKQRQLVNRELETRNQVIAEKKQEIDNSIQYAKGIQQAILPDLSELKSSFAQSFVYYKPKDVVSGDFYWFSKVEDDFYCIAADCTGHGVPGALMSIIGMDKIVQAIYEKQITEPGKILAFLNRQIKQVLKQHSDASKQKDGMDMALLKFNAALTEVQFAGANRPLYLVRGAVPGLSDSTPELIEYKPDKTAIAGFTPDDMEFHTTTISLAKHDALFIFTDGYADQFGGGEGKKFMSRNLKQLLVSVAALPAEEQQEKINRAFTEWKADYEQVDDVLVMGIKL